ncbi:MAG: hypothetical protein SH847_17835, partial [Roseiflexaceae bacterium]|nr:hypothetical protein [Roseiflexaceae bacterium]
MKRRQFIGVAALALALAGGATTYAASKSTPVTQAINAQLAAQNSANNQRGPGGQVASVSGTTITVTNPNGTQTIATTSATTFELDGAASTLS